MCDSFVVLPHRSASGGMLFAKNSDRERNEAQFIETTPRARHAAGSGVRLTYIAIPQAPETNACLISRPFWMWGAEMGANEHGVVIGNEAMHATAPPQEQPALTGMDLVRLGLERAATAAAAVDVITTLLERYGQGGNCGHLRPFFYHNGFLIADGREAYVLETVGRWWAVERVADQRALSNAYSIGRHYDRASSGLIQHARASGWTGADGRFDFAERFIDHERDAVSFGRGRCDRGALLLNRHAGKLDPAAMMRLLRDHGPEGEAALWTPEKTERRSICMHAGEGERRSQTTASMVTQWRADGRAVHWLTASAAPCLSIFKPMLIGTPPVRDPEPPRDRFDGAQRWWRHERLHRAALADYARHADAIAEERDALEARFAATLAAALDADAAAGAVNELIAQCWREADAAEARWFAAIAEGARDGLSRNAYGDSWREHDLLAGMSA